MKLTPVGAAVLTLSLSALCPVHAQQPSAAHSSNIAGGGNTWRMKKGEFRSQIGHHAMPAFGIAEEPLHPVIALSMMYPVDWTFHAEIVNGARDCNFTTGRMLVVSLSPDKTSGVVLLPGRVTLWSENRGLLQSVTADNQRTPQLYHCETEQPQPLSARIRRLAVSTANKGTVVQGDMQPLRGLTEKLPALLQQVNAQLAQDAARTGRPATRLIAEAGQIAVTGEQNGTPTEGYFAALQITRIDPLPGGGSMIATDLPLQLAYFTPRGQLAASEPMVHAMLDSVVINPLYSQDCAEQASIVWEVTRQTKAKLARIASEMAADNANTARQNALIQQGVADYSAKVHASVDANRSAALEHSSQQFALYMGDQAVYKDPSTGDRVQMPSQYGHAWANGSAGEYILTDSASYNPNGHVGSGSWTPMQLER